MVKTKEELGDDLVSPDSNRAFSSRPKWAQAVVLLAGVTMNILLAWLLFAVVLMSGVPSAVTETEASPEAELYVAGTMPDSPAAEQLPLGVIIKSVSSESGKILENPTPSSFSQFVIDTAPELLTVRYQQGDEIETTELAAKQGLDDSNTERYLVGASLTLVEEVQRGPIEAIRDGFTATLNGLVAIATGLYTLISDALIGQGDFSNVAGPVGIVGLVGDAADSGWTALLSFTAIISLNLAIINLLPFPALDGGRLLFVLIEAVTKREIPPRIAGYTNAIGFMLLLLLMVLVTYQDIMRLL